MLQVKKLLTVISLAAVLTSGTVYADNTTQTTQLSEQNGKALLKGAYDYLGSLQKYAFTATINNTIKDDGKSIKDKRTVSAKVKRPDQFRIDSKGDFINRSSYLSNGVFTMIDNDEKYYASVKTNGGIDKTLDMINRKLGIVLPTSTLLHSDMAKFIHPKRVQNFGVRTLAGVECNYIAFKQKSTTVHLWIENSDRPVIHAAKIISPDSGMTDMVIKWDTNPGFSDSVFVFKAPQGASNVSIKPEK